MRRRCHFLALLSASSSVFLSPLLSSVASANAGPSLPPSTLSALAEVVAIRDDGIPSAGPAAAAAAAVDGTAIPSPREEEDWRRSLPSGLRERQGAPLHRVEMDGGVVLYLLGSSHVSRTSCDDVKLLMEHVRPDVLFVELCSQRVGLLLDPPSPLPENEQQLKHGKDRKLADASPLTNRGSLLYAKIQADYAKKLNVTIGGEFREAFQSALSQQRQFWDSRQHGSSRSGVYRPASSHPRDNRPCAVILGDRPVRITLLRAWESLRIFGKFKLMLALLWSSIVQPSEKELREWMESILNDRTGKNDLITKAMEEMGKAFPTLKRVIIEERDEFMVAKLMQIAAALLHSPNQGDSGKVVVAVCGAGHCPGMLEKLTKKGALLREVDESTLMRASIERRPENILPNLVETKKRKVDNDAELSSLVTDLVQFDYSYLSESEPQ